MEINTEVEVGGSLLQVGPGQKPQDLIQKTTKAKGAGNVTQVVEHLPSKCKVLSSKPITTKMFKMLF
jgi:hypothetical protein